MTISERNGVPLKKKKGKRTGLKKKQQQKSGRAGAGLNGSIEFQGPLNRHGIHGTPKKPRPPKARTPAARKTPRQADKGTLKQLHKFNKRVSLKMD